MAYRFKKRRSIPSEVTRIVDKQLALAIAELHGVAARRCDDPIHEARRHVKEVRAILRLVQPALGDACHIANEPMRTASRLLAPIADGRAMVDTVDRLMRRYRTRPARRALTATRAVVSERAARIGRKVELDRVLPKVARVLQLERAHAGAWTVNGSGFRAIAPGLKASGRGARKAMARAAAKPTAENYRVYRRRVKALWFHVRLVEGHCGNMLIADQRRLEALDGVLGESHDVALLEQVLMTEALLPRKLTARALRVLRRYLLALRHRASRMGHRALTARPRHFVRRIKRLWQSANTAEDTAEAKTSWPHAA